MSRVVLLTWPCIRSTVISVVTAARARKSSRNRTRSVRYRSTSPSIWPLIFFKVRLPENHMFIVTNERGQDDVPTCTSFAYDSINSPHLETHYSMSPRIFACIDSGLMFPKASASFANSNASRIASSSVRTLSSRSTCRTKAWRRDGKKKEWAFHILR
jgi:hypothetical protein